MAEMRNQWNVLRRLIPGVRSLFFHPVIGFFLTRYAFPKDVQSKNPWSNHPMQCTPHLRCLYFHPVTGDRSDCLLTIPHSVCCHHTWLFVVQIKVSFKTVSCYGFHMLTCNLVIAAKRVAVVRWLCTQAAEVWESAHWQLVKACNSSALLLLGVICLTRTPI